MGDFTQAAVVRLQQDCCFNGAASDRLGGNAEQDAIGTDLLLRTPRIMSAHDPRKISCWNWELTFHDNPPDSALNSDS
jgi:hypothetical protein